VTSPLAGHLARSAGYSISDFPARGEGGAKRRMGRPDLLYGKAPDGETRAFVRRGAGWGDPSFVRQGAGWGDPSFVRQGAGWGWRSTEAPTETPAPRLIANPGAERLKAEEARYFFFFVAFLTAFLTAFLIAFFFPAMSCTSLLCDAARPDQSPGACDLTMRLTRSIVLLLRYETQIGRKEMTPTDRLSDFGSSLATGSDSVERVPRGRNEH